MFATLLGVAAYLVRSGSLGFGAGLGAVSALALIVRFLPEFLRTKKVMPPGLVVTVGVWVVVLCALALVS